MGQALATILRIASQSGPTALAELLECGAESRRCRHAFIAPPRASDVPAAVQRIQHTCRKLAGFLEHGVDDVRRQVLASRQRRDVVHADQFLDREFHVTQWRAVGGHLLLLKAILKFHRRDAESAEKIVIQNNDPQLQELDRR